MDDHLCSDLSSKREKNAERREIFRMLAWMREMWHAVEPDLSVRREEYVDRIKQVLKQKGRKV